MSSQYESDDATKCINGITDGGRDQICGTHAENAPWLAIEFQSEKDVSQVVINNRKDADGQRTRNLEVRLTNELPASGERMFTGGQLLGTFVGPATDGQVISISSAQSRRGKYVLVQQTHGDRKDHLNLLEVTAFGVTVTPTTKLNPIEPAIDVDESTNVN